ncbi:MAG: hypothetical protein HFI63_10990 [Lachnospiraceae bacterium]|nr:hypothetical protein [Lachnospiraceae bacterium]
MSIASAALLTGFYGSDGRRQTAAEQNPKIDVDGSRHRWAADRLRAVLNSLSLNI